jgi:hypothetical protein
VGQVRSLLSREIPTTRLSAQIRVGDRERIERAVDDHLTATEVIYLGRPIFEI